MANINNFLGRLQKCRKTGKQTWMACCPAHNDKNPSMIVTEGIDGRVLVHCFSHECGIDSIVEAVGMEIRDLMPDNVGFHRSAPKSRLFNAIDVLHAIRDDLTMTLIVAKDIQRGKILTTDESLSLSRAIGRVSTAIKLAGGE